MMRRRDVVAGLAAGVAAGVAGAAFLPSRVVAAGVSPAEAEVKALFAVRARRRRSLCRRWDRKRWGSGARGAGRGRGRCRQPPHSTFKIWNTLIALETGAAPDAGFQQRYDPVKYPREDWWPETWLQDQTLESAFRRSAVWYYRELALRGGRRRCKPGSPGWATATRTSPAGSTASGSAAVCGFPARAGGLAGAAGARRGAVQPGARGDPAADHGAGPGRGLDAFGQDRAR